MFGLTTGFTIVLILCLLIACAFEFINGFHDTANAVATVIYTKSLKPKTAVVWSGVWNFIGVYFGGIAVAIGIINLLPMEALVDQNIYHNIAMIFSLILTAVLWNLATWYLGIPCSSSHTLIGSIFGVGLAFMFITPEGVIALNWNKLADAGLSLLISPVLGFIMAMLLMFLFRRFVRHPKFFKEPDKVKSPPFWIRGILILTCTSVSFSHGSNDGQKGIGLVMIILIGFLPSYFALDPDRNPLAIGGNIQVIEHYVNRMDTTKMSVKEAQKMSIIKSELAKLKLVLSNLNIPFNIEKEKKFEVRKSIIEISTLTKKMIDNQDFQKRRVLLLTEKESVQLNKNLKELRGYTEFAPWWVMLMISLSLGIGTMVGWKRIVTTIGEKIGKTHLSYAQGASAEMIAASTIGISTLLGLPVSTTHVLSSGVAGTMVAHGGLKNLQRKTIKNILIAWGVTIPITIIFACFLFIFSRWLVNFLML